MQQQLLILVALQDVDEMIREARDPARASEMEGLGFKVQNLPALEDSRVKLVERLTPAALSLYERISKRFGRAVVPVQGGVCLGCFMALPTQHIGIEEREDPTGERVPTCENCGRILYWL